MLQCLDLAEESPLSPASKDSMSRNLTGASTGIIAEREQECGARAGLGGSWYGRWFGSAADKNPNSPARRSRISRTRQSRGTGVTGGLDLVRPRRCRMKTVDAKARISAKNILCATDVSPVRTDAVFRMAGPGDRS